MMWIVKNLSIIAALAATWLAAERVAADEQASALYVGRATTSITPDRLVPLSGQMRTRISQSVETPLTATALALESRQGERSVDQATWVSCDLVAILQLLGGQNILLPVAGHGNRPRIGAVTKLDLQSPRQTRPRVRGHGERTASIPKTHCEIWLGDQAAPPAA